MQKYENASRMSKKDIMVSNFLGGLFWALGATIGLSVIVTVLTMLSKQLHLIPVIGTFVADITKFVTQHNR